MKQIEDLSLNAWPSYQMQVYDGWLLRFSHFYTHRTNCVEQIGLSCLPLEEKIRYCEEVYRSWGTPCIFKQSPFTDPDLDGLLEKRGYHIEHPVMVMTADRQGALASPGLPEGYRARMDARVDGPWISRLFELKGNIAFIHRQIVPNMYEAIPKDEIAVTVYYGNETAGLGLGILDRGFVGVYAIHVRREHRRRGLASFIVQAILDEAVMRGFGRAYLQVVEDNAPARQLYRSLGFQDSYRCYFRVRDVRS